MGHGAADSWISCQLGHRHWGRFGAAGLLVRHEGRMLLQLRSRLAHNGGTWSIPGGACQSGEQPLAAAMREFAEETGVDPVGLGWAPQLVDVADHVGWSYSTFVAEVVRQPTVTSESWEVGQHGWYTPQQAANLRLHPDFAEMLKRWTGQR